MTGRFKKALEETAAWQKKAGKNPEGGLNQKGVDSYKKENPGSKLKTAVTTKPSKLKKGSKSANRRKSFCARMGGMKKSRTSAKTANDPDSRINKALRKWNCSTDINSKGDPAMNERNKQNRDAVRKMTSGQTPAEAKAQRSLKTANPDWITSDDKKSPRQQAHDSRRGVKQAREALAEACWKGYKAKGMKKKGSKMVPNCVKEEADPTKTTRASIKQGEGDANIYSKIKAKKDAASKPQAEKSKSVRRETLGRSGGMHDKKGTPANPSSNHPDYLKKKLHQRSTKDGGYGKTGETKAADTKVNQKGVRGQEAAIAKKKAGSARQAMAQRISNKLRAKRGLVPLMPGEKHSSNDKLGKTEN